MPLPMLPGAAIELCEGRVAVGDEWPHAKVRRELECSGVNASGLIMDELAAWPHREIYDVMASRTGSRRSPLSTIITTAGSDEHGVGKEVYDYACRVRDGIVDDPSFLPIIYEAPADADAWSEETWRVCNPALGDFRSLEEFRIAARHAKEVPGREASFRRLYLNQWVTQQDQPWLSLAAWDACKVTPRAETLSGRRAFLGLDLSTTTDLTALVVLLLDEDGGFDVRAEFFCPAAYIAERAKRDRVPYELWAKQGFLQATPGNIVNKPAVAKRIHELMAQYEVAALGVDPWNAKDLVAELQKDGVPAVEVPQTMAGLTSASKKLEELVLSGALRHDGHPILRWCVANAVADVDGNGNVKPSKKRSRERIDGVSALVTALARAIVDVGPVKSVYEERGVIVL
jgi:phage terminase large subunit-like protein